MAANQGINDAVNPVTNQRMDWQKLLCSDRLDKPSAVEEQRSAYDKDYDKIVFSRAFRRLGNKTQVHPLATNDHVHNRLTHSLEVGAVGRSLGRLAGKHILHAESSSKLRKEHDTSDFGSIVHAACLAHDIGNPPFGHAGESAIRQWMIGNKELLKGIGAKKIADLTRFEGNAQGFRILTKSKELRICGGLGITAATLGAMIKYPWHSDHFLAQPKGKFGFFQSEYKEFEKIAELLGLLPIEELDNNGKLYKRRCRHPLAFLVEAADDICYTIMDLEDALELKILTWRDMRRYFISLSGVPEKIEGRRIAVDRANAIKNLIHDCVEAFIENYESIMCGEFTGALVEYISEPAKQTMQDARDLAFNNVYPIRRNTELELGCYSALRTILDEGMHAARDIDSGDNNYKQKHLLRLIGSEMKDDQPLYERYMIVTDYVSGMTDDYATHIASQLSGNARG